MIFDNKFMEIVRKLRDAGFEAYLVGGAVRDIILGMRVNDLDIATNARPDDIENIFDGHHTKSVGKSFGVMLIDGFEVATYRKDRYFGLDDKNVEITYSDCIEDDLERRDLTINAMALDPITHDIIDLFNSEDDLATRTIRFVGNPCDRIYEDPNRIIRACRFKSVINGSFDNDTFTALQDYSVLVKTHVDPERIRKEIFKALLTRKTSLFFFALHSINALKYIFPSLNNCYAHEHGKYHAEDIFVHSMLCGDAISVRYPLTKLAGYLHDVGKPPTFNPVDQSFKGHEKHSVTLLDSELRDLHFSNKEREFLCNIISYHMQHVLNVKDSTMRKLLSKLANSKVRFSDFLRLRLADKSANTSSRAFTFNEVSSLIRQANRVLDDKNTAFTIHDLDINGYTIMNILGISSCPRVGQCLSHIFDKVMNSELENDRQILENYVRNDF